MNKRLAQDCGAAVKERGILFSGGMVRALLDGRKTQTRRVMKPQPCDHESIHGKPLGVLWPGKHPPATQTSDRAEWIAGCPYGAVGERLWVRETFISGEERGSTVWYRASQKNQRINVRWSSPIHMPRWASRLTLQITELRVERLQSISDDDAQAEGVTTDSILGTLNGKPATLYPMSHRQSFIWLWDSINGKRANWASNPFVWALSFRALDAKERAS